MPSLPTADAVVCGAGIAGISAAHQLAAHHDLGRVVLVDERPPLSLTSDKSTECYRSFWPGPDPAMFRLVERSIDRLEALAREHGNPFALNRRGYAYLSADPARAESFEAAARQLAAWGAGPVRLHRDGSTYEPAPERGFEDPLGGCDLILDPAAIRALYPHLTADVAALLHPRRAGWLSAQQLGMHLLEAAREHGTELVRGRLVGVAVEGERVAAVTIAMPGGETTRLATPCLVDAAGPRVDAVAALAGVELPVLHELHWKVTFEDHLGVVPRQLPLMIWSDPVTLEWSPEERRELAADPARRHLLETMPAGVHFRPEGGPESHTLLLLWAYEAEPVTPRLPLPEPDPAHAEIVLRGLIRMVPGLATYLERARRPYVDGGYYTKTRDNRPLIGPLPVEGAYVIGALSGFGVMASQGAAELLGAHVTGATLPPWADAFRLERFDDPAYRQMLDGWGAATGQL